MTRLAVTAAAVLLLASSITATSPITAMAGWIPGVTLAVFAYVWPVDNNRRTR